MSKSYWQTEQQIVLIPVSKKSYWDQIETPEQSVAGDSSAMPEIPVQITPEKKLPVPAKPTTFEDLLTSIPMFTKSQEAIQKTDQELSARYPIINKASGLAQSTTDMVVNSFRKVRDELASGKSQEARVAMGIPDHFLDTLGASIIDSALRVPEDKRAIREGYSQKIAEFAGNVGENIGEFLLTSKLFTGKSQSFFKTMATQSAVDETLKDSPVDQKVKDYFKKDIPLSLITAGAFKIGQMVNIPENEAVKRFVVPLSEAWAKVTHGTKEPTTEEAVKIMNSVLNTINNTFKGAAAGIAQTVGEVATGTPLPEAAKSGLTTGIFAGLSGGKKDFREPSVKAETVPALNPGTLPDMPDVKPVLAEEYNEIRQKLVTLTAPGVQANKDTVKEIVKLHKEGQSIKEQHDKILEKEAKVKEKEQQKAIDEAQKAKDEQIEQEGKAQKEKPPAVQPLINPVESKINTTIPMDTSNEVKNIGDNQDLFQVPKYESTKGHISLEVIPDKSIKDTLKEHWKNIGGNYWFASKGDLPEEAFKAVTEKNSNINATKKKLDFFLRDFNSARKATKATDFEINAYLAGESKGEKLSPQMRSVIDDARNQIDDLSQEMIDLGMIDDKLLPVFEANKGIYLTRTYRSDREKDWAKKVPPDVINRAKAYIRKDFPDLPEEQLQGEIDSLLNSHSDMFDIVKRGGKQGSKSLDILMKRRKIPEEIRALKGEYKNADVNAVTSLMKMSTLIENTKLLRKVYQKGLGKFLFDTPTNKDGISYSTQVAGDTTKTYDPLGGLYTSKEIVRELKDFNNTGIDFGMFSGVFKTYMKGVATMKFAKTIGSIAGQLRNVIANPMFAVKSGYWDLGKFKQTFKATMTDLSVMNDKQWREYVVELTRAGVIDEGVVAQELRQAVKDATSQDYEKVFTKGIASIPRKTVNALEKTWMAGDNIYKIFGYENELAILKGAKSQWSEQKIKEVAQKNVSNNIPTYRLTPRIVKLFKRLPVGPFVTWSAEVVRTTYKTLELINTEMKDPELRGVASRRLIGMMAFLGAVGVAVKAKDLMDGTSKEEKESMRRFLPYWSKNSQIMLVKKHRDDLSRYYIDFGFIDPASTIKNPVIAFMRGEDWKGSLLGSLGEISRPYMSEDIFSQKMIDLKRNKRQKDGKPVYNPQDNIDQQIEDALSHMWEGFEPGTITSIKKLTKKKGLERNIEAVSTLGLRISKLDPKKSFSFKARDFNVDLRNAFYAGDGNLEKRKESVKRVFDEFHKDIQAAKILGMNEPMIARILIAQNTSALTVGMLINGNYNQMMDKYIEIEDFKKKISNNKKEAIQGFKWR
jgi:hypothetical protein